MKWVADVVIALRPSVLDPAGTAVAASLQQLGHTSVEAVRIGKHITLSLEATDAAAAQSEVEAMCEALLANTVIETYRVSVREA